MLEAACHNIATWYASPLRRDIPFHLQVIRPKPTPGKTLELGFLGSVLHVEIPHSIDVQQLTDTSSFNEKYNPRSHARVFFDTSIKPADLCSDFSNDGTFLTSSNTAL